MAKELGHRRSSHFAGEHLFSEREGAGIRDSLLRHRIRTGERTSRASELIEAGSSATSSELISAAMGAAPDLRAVEIALRSAGACFAFVHGSRASGESRRGSDLDLAAWWTGEAPAAWDVSLPEGVDLLVLNSAPLELAGRVALDGEILFDADPPRRVEWQARTRKIYLDEEQRQKRLDSIFLERVQRG